MPLPIDKSEAWLIERGFTGEILAAYETEAEALENVGLYHAVFDDAIIGHTGAWDGPLPYETRKGKGF